MVRTFLSLPLGAGAGTPGPSAHPAATATDTVSDRLSIDFYRSLAGYTPPFIGDRGREVRVFTNVIGAYAMLMAQSVLPLRDLYWEVQVVALANQMQVGVVWQDFNDADPNPYIGFRATDWGYDNVAYLHAVATTTVFGATYTSGDVIGVALSASGDIWFSKNGVWQGSGNPATRANPAATGVTSRCPAIAMDGAAGVTARARLRLFAAQQSYAPPTGFTTLG